jgi:hypothetical protein
VEFGRGVVRGDGADNAAFGLTEPKPRSNSTASSSIDSTRLGAASSSNWIGSSGC